MAVRPLIVFDVNETLLDLQTMDPIFERIFGGKEAMRLARELGVSPSNLCLIACHTWDTLGAVAAGWQAALIKRVGNEVLGVGPQPQIVGSDLNAVADQLIALSAAG